MTGPSSGDISVRSINQEIIGMDGPNHLVNQIIPSIGIINPGSFRLHAMNNRLTFSSVSSTTGRLGIFAAQKGAQQRAMINVLADIALESEAATVSALRIARAFDSDDPGEAAFRRLALAVMKYWVCKRGAPLAAEALECLGGNGYVEEAPMAQFYRDIQIGTVWEGSGNVIALDVLRALNREPEAAAAFLAECELARGAEPRFDVHLARDAAGQFG